MLPFTNIGDDRDQQYFADGITDDLMTDLSRAVGMFVISRNTAFAYRNKPADAKQIGRELGVRYVLEGSVRRSGNQLRVNAQLIDAETDAHHLVAWIGIWQARSDRYRRAARFLTFGQSSCHSKRTKIAVNTSRSSGTE